MFHTRLGFQWSVCFAALSIFGMTGIGGCAAGSSDKDIKAVKITQFRALVEESKAKPNEVLVIDARSPDEYKAAHIEGARNLRPDQLRAESPIFAQLNEFGTIVVYGADPASGAAKQATKRLMDYSSSKVLWFQGGMKFWRAAGYPLVEPEPTTAVKGVTITPTTSLPPIQQPQPAGIPTGIPR